MWLLHEDEVEAWAAAQSPTLRRWVGEQNFKGERHRVVLLPDAQGGLAGALGGLGKRQGPLSLWHAAGIAERLPPRRYSLAAAFRAPPRPPSSPWALPTRPTASSATNASSPSARRVSIRRPIADLGYVAAAAESLAMARDWINTPARDFGPAELAAAVQRLAERHAASYREWVGEDLLRANFPAIHAVGRASAAAPRLVELRWPAAADGLPKLVLVGKGVCFDSGGLDIKASAGMALMKKDMGGAAVALGLAHLLIASKIRADLRVLIPAVENSISGNAYRPGDVLRTRKGLSVEVGNTDAEGRLVLCDALALADAERPDLIIDFATLTGAARVALGPELPALFGSDDQVVGDLARAAAAEHDPLWPMPLWSPYDDELGSKIADVNNISPSGLAGAIFGALFLKRFVTDSAHWVHIDLYAWNPKERPGRSVGAEAQALRGVHRYLMARYGVAR